LVVGAVRRSLCEAAAPVAGGESRGGARGQASGGGRIPANHPRRVGGGGGAGEDVGGGGAGLRWFGGLRGRVHRRLEARGVVVGEVADDRLATGFRLGEVAEV